MAPQMSIPSLQDTMSTVFTDPMDKFDPSWKERAAQGEQTAGGITDLITKFMGDTGAVKMFGEAIERSGSIGKLLDDMLAGRISAADQAGLSRRSAENARSLGMWGGAVGGAARGLEARDLGLSQRAVQEMGIKQAGQVMTPITEMLKTLSGVSTLGSQASQDTLSMQLAKGGIGVAQDWMGMNMQMQAANLNAAARFGAGQMMAKGIGDAAKAPQIKRIEDAGGSLVSKNYEALKRAYSW